MKRSLIWPFLVTKGNYKMNQPVKLTKEYIQSLIISDQYHTFEGTTLTLCVLKTKNGATITGESYAARPEDFNTVTGQEESYKKAFQTLWDFEGYLLKQKLYEFQKSLETDIGM